MNEIRGRLENDYRLREILDDSLTYAERSLEDETFRMDPDSIERGAELIRRSRAYIFQHHRKDVEHIFREVESFVSDLQEDPLTQELTNDIKKVSDDIFIQRYLIFIDKR